MLQDYCYWISVYRQNCYQSTLPTMVFLLGASSLLSAYNTLSYRTKKIFNGSFFAAPGLSFNHKDKIKNVNYLLQNEHGKLKRKTDIVIWHDVINNSITPHKSNNNIGLTTEELNQMLLSHKEKINSIIYCQRIATNNIFKSLLKTKILVIDAKKKLFSHRNSKNSFICFQLQQIHPCKKLESKLMLIVWTKRKNLKSLVYKFKKSKPPKKERKKNQGKEVVKKNKPSKSERERKKRQASKKE